MALQPDLIVYGGAYDPPHQGHLDCMRCAAKRFPKAQILVMPGLQPAGASDTHKTPSASFEHRLAMCKEAVAKAGLENVTVSDLESRLPAPNYTLQTIRELHQQAPHARLGLLFGQDQLQVFDRWHQPIDILRLASVIVVRRDSLEHGYGGSVVEAMDRQAAKLHLHLRWSAGAREAEVLEIPGCRFYIIDQQISLAESTRIRQAKARVDHLPAGWLPEAVARYIKANALYQNKNC